MNIDAKKDYSPVEIEALKLIPSRTKVASFANRHTIKRLVEAKRLKGNIIKKKQRTLILVRGSDLLDYLDHLKNLK